MDGRSDRSGSQYRAPCDEDEPCQCMHSCHHHRQGCCDAPWTVICIHVPLGANVQCRFQSCFRDLGCHFGCCHYGHAYHYRYNDHYFEDDRFSYHNHWPSNDRHLPNQMRRMHHNDYYDASYRSAEDMARSDDGSEMHHRRRNNENLEPIRTSENCRDDRRTAGQEQTLHWNAHSDNRRGEDQLYADFGNLNVQDEKPTTGRLRHDTMGKLEYGMRRRYLSDETGCTGFAPGEPRRHVEGMFDGFDNGIGERNMTTSGVEKSKVAKTKKRFTVPLPDAQVYFPWNEKLPSDIATDFPEDLANIEAEDGWACGFVHEPHSNLRPVIIDGSNVAMAYYNDGRRYSAIAVSHAIEYFLRRGHPVVAVLPRGHLEENSPYKVTDAYVFSYLLSRRLVILTPVINWNNREGPMRDTPCENHFIAEQAYLSGSIIVSNDSFKDVAAMNPSWKALLSRVIRFGWDENGNFEPRSKMGPLSEWTLKAKLLFNKNEKVYHVAKPMPEEKRKEVLPVMHHFESYENVTSR